MRKFRGIVALVLAMVLVLGIGVSASAEDNYKQKVLDYMASEAAKVNVPEDNARYQESVKSVKNYTGNFEGVAAMSAADKEAFFTSLGKHLEESAKKVGVTVTWKTTGYGAVIKQTGINYTSTIVMLLAAVAMFGGCVVFARKKELFA